MGAVSIVVTMASTQPLVTVGMAVYNGEKYIAEAISSVLAETYQAWELLLVNDCSRDSSIDVARSFTDPRIRVLENDTNLGLVGVRNKIMQEARGTYIAWLDQDDLTLPARLSTQVAFLEANPDYAVCGSWTKTRTELPDGLAQIATEHLPCSHEEIRAAMLFLNPIACNTVTMRRKDFVSRGLEFRPAFGNSLDYDLWSMASDELRMCNLPQALAIYRVHGDQTSQGDALERMNGRAMEIQVGLAQRALEIEMSDDDRTWHRLATIAPVIVESASDLNHVADWFGRLRAANAAQRSFDVWQFDRALSRQWTTVVLSALRSVVGPTTAITIALKGFQTMGVGKTSIASSLTAGARRRKARHG